MGNFHDANYNITKIRTDGGEVVELELNGKAVTLPMDVESNKEVTINVQEYTEPVEITPTAGKDGMKKATVTLSNIPSPAGVSKFFCWRCDTSPEYYKYAYTATDSPSIETKYVANGESGEVSPLSSYSIAEVGDGYFVSEYQVRYERYSDGDI